MDTKSKKVADGGGHKTMWILRKYANEMAHKAGEAYEVKKIDGNVLCIEGLNETNKLKFGTGATKYDNTNARLIVGTGTGEAADTDTEASFTNPVLLTMDTGFPTYGTNQKVIFQATAASGIANQAWEEFGVTNAASGGKLLNHKVQSQGTKILGQIWVLSLEIVYS